MNTHDTNGTPSDGFFFDVFGERPPTRGGLLLQHLVVLLAGTVAVLLGTLVVVFTLWLFRDAEYAARVADALTFQRMTGVLPVTFWWIGCAIGLVLSQVLFVREGRAYLWGGLIGFGVGTAVLLVAAAVDSAAEWGGAAPIVALWVGYLAGLVIDWVGRLK